MAALSTIASQFAAARRTVAPQPGSPTPPPPPPSGGTSGNIILTNASGPVVSEVPIVTGIPFPAGTLFDLAELRLEDPTTTVQKDAQFDELVKHPDGSYKAVQVVYSDAVGASATTQRLVYGPGTTRATNGTVIGATTNSGVTTVSDGNTVVTFDVKGNMTSAARAGATTITGSWLEETEAAVAARLFDSVNSVGSVVTIEENGPKRVVVKVRGTLRSSGGVNYRQFVTRWYIYAGTGVIDFDDTTVDEQSSSNENSGIPLVLSYASRSFTRKFTYSVDGTPQYRFGGESAAMYSGNITGEHYLFQDGDFPYTRAIGVPCPGHTFAYSGVGTGTYAPGFMNIQGSTGSKRVGIFLKDLWQCFPGELNINTGTFELRYFTRRGVSTWQTTAPANPEYQGNDYKRPNPLYSRSAGIAYTYRGRIHLHSAAKSDAELHAENTLFQRNDLECMAPQAWYLTSGVFGDLMAIDAEAATGQVAWFLRSNIRIAITNMLPTQSGGQGGSSTSAGGGTMFGKRDYGDRIRTDSEQPNFQQGTHISSDALFELFLMTGKKEFWDFAFTETEHYYDVDLRHAPYIPYANYGAPASNAPAGGTRFQGHNALDHEGDHDYSEHYHVSGMPHKWMLTCDKRAKDCLEETMTWIEYITRYTHKMPFVLGDKYRESDRYFGYPILGMVEANKAFNSRSYHVAIAARVQYMIDWMKTDSPHFGYNPDTGLKVYGASPSPYAWPTGTPIGMNQFTAGTGVWACQRADNSYGGYTTGTSPWFSMPTLEGISQFRDMELAWLATGAVATINMSDLNHMMFQEMKYLIRFCFDETTQRFTYSEEARPPSFNTPGDSAGSVHNTLGCNVMLYIDKLYRDELAAGRIANPEWYTETIGTKLPILNQMYSNMMWNTSSTTNSQPYTTYGYEKTFSSFYRRTQRMGYHA